MTVGHNLGMNHAVQWRSNDADGSDFMGSGANGLNAPHIVEMGWLRRYPGKVVELVGSADVTLEALETDPGLSAVPKVAIIRPASGANSYYLSYRASSAADPLPDAFTRGVNIHIVDAARRTGGLTYFVTSLTDNATYHDGPMIVQQLSHIGSERVRLRISFTGTGTAMPAGPPPAPPGTMQSLASGKCLDLPGGRAADGTPLIQYDCVGSLNQQWNIKPAGDAGYQIVSDLSGKCIGTDGKDAASGGRIVQSQCGSPSQLWVRESTGNGSFSKHSEPSMPGCSRRITRQRRPDDCMGLQWRHQPDLALPGTPCALRSKRGQWRSLGDASKIVPIRPRTP